MRTCFLRKFEDKLAALYIQQKLEDFYIYTTVKKRYYALHAMDLTKDKMITAYRNHVQPIGMGVDPKRVMAELLGKVTGTSKGMGGSMHIFLKSIVLWRSRNCRRTNSVQD
jgi:pyruvate dehydrogenase E1 component alpha subunit